MFKNKSKDGKLNICGTRIAKLRKKLNISQRELAEQMQLLGIDFSKNAIQQIESRDRFVTDIELIVFSFFFETTIDYLVGLEGNLSDQRKGE